MSFQNKRILVLGAGISGISVAAILQSLGAKVTLSDTRPRQLIDKDFSKLETLGVSLVLGSQDESLLAGIDCVVLSPGVSIYIPLIKAAKAKEIQVISEVEVAYQLCKAPIIAVTGTNGKTTTTTLLGEMLKTTYKDVVIGGNIGQALSQEVAMVGDSGIVIAEISSFQLEAALSFRPKIAVILNITPDHIDRHRTMNTYIKMKEKIFAKQTLNDFIILNYDDDIVRNMANKAQSKVVFFSRKTVLTSGVFVQDDIIKINWNGDVISICSVADLQIKGAHNIENALAACGAAFLAGVKAHEMARVLRGFIGVEHRIEPVVTIKGVQYYNDSKATNPESAIKALEAFSGGVILIAGGRDKKTDLTEFMKLVKEKVRHLILIGEASDRFRESAIQQGVKNISCVVDMKSAVRLAHEFAREKEVVLLSPACSSYDMFKNYEERGRAFKNFVQQLA
ncbi:UDP-N-acetylmuramoylalanine--D-glutamate ligase [bioreactor metagenome]|uniref:UDP-N-acetylmuramoylalanine--D-glutamate ligase n=1 Tax=bioreactor metagenome TaxID=1076179 RepID=A0A644T1D1_9ZZZZ